MRNSFSGLITITDDSLYFCLYEIGNEFDHHHRIVIQQKIEPNEIRGLILEFERIVDDIELYYYSKIKKD